MIKLKSYKMYFLVMGAILVLIGYCAPEPIDWSRAYHHDGQRPYDTKLIVDNLGYILDSGDVHLANAPVYDLEIADTLGQFNYILISPQLNLDADERDTLLSHVAGGATVFIASDYIDYDLRDTLDISWGALMSLPADSIQFLDTNRFELGFTYPGLGDSQFTYQGFYWQQNYFDAEVEHVEAIGTLQDSFINFVRVPFGRGYFYLHGYPLAFTNYNFTEGDNAQYIARCLSMLPRQETYWDVYYTRGKRWGESTTPMRFVLSHPSLRKSWYILLLMAVLFVLLQFKRTQRMIPIVEAYANSSLDFAKTVGNIYFHKKDHLDLAQKKVKYLLAFIRDKYGLSTQTIDDDFAHKLVLKSKKPASDISALKEAIKYVENATTSNAKITPAKLHHIAKIIDKFMYSTEDKTAQTVTKK